MGAEQPEPATSRQSQDGEHYFTAEPVSPAQHRRLRVELAGREVEVVTAGGVFSPTGVDKGTAVLLEDAPPPPTAGTFLDLGCGWGPMALTLGMLAPQARVIAVDVNRRALDLLARNAAALDLSGIEPSEPGQVPADVTFDLIWSNPPIRIGKPALHALLRSWLPRLSPGGEARLVVQRNLGADSLLRWMQQEFAEFDCERESSSRGFRVLRVHRPSAP